MPVNKNYDLGDVLHRLIKQTLDSGACKSIAEAEELFRRYRIHIEISPADAEKAEHQATILTVVVILLLAVAFGSGLIVGRYYL